ncbi:MAG: tRNA uridine-5-carboxymethylaminomethyl(34) synthesis enzyme MnmG [Gemmatimonadales bacterium]
MAPRAQCDRGLYRRAVRAELERLPNVRFRQGTVSRFLVEGGRVTGVVTTDGRRFSARAVVVTAGTFLRGRIFVGLESQIPAGRAVKRHRWKLRKYCRTWSYNRTLQDGTPPRIDGRSVDFARLERQSGDAQPYWFSHFERHPHPKQLPCYLTHTTDRLRDIVTAHLHQSAMYGGQISGRGPRCCPSIEDKIVRFPEARRHQVFLEPEGLDTTEMYVNGLSTSLPAGVQLDYLRTVPGLEAVDMTRPGYAIEYDYFPPTQLDHRLAVKAIGGLFFAGQVNGTTGYEEAAGQGAVAGLNAAAEALGKPPVEFPRDQSFIGVMVDDLVTRGVDEPYRLFTSRSEFRLLLRQDNALRRLLPTTLSLGLLSVAERAVAEERLAREDKALSGAAATAVRPGDVNEYLEAIGERPIGEPTRIAEIARRPGVSLHELFVRAEADFGDPEWSHWAEVELRYGGYLDRERVMAERLRDLEGFRIPEGIDFLAMNAVSFEAREKLTVVRPATLGHASRIPGITPSDLQVLMFEVSKRRN